MLRASCASRRRFDRIFRRSSTYMIETATSVIAMMSSSPHRIWMIAFVSTA